MDSIYKDIVKKKDDAIFAEIQSSFGVDLDRGELIRALQYDRNQYEKGYWDGMADAKAELVRCKDCKHLKYGYQCYCPLGMNLNNDGDAYVLVEPDDDFCSHGERKEENK